MAIASRVLAAAVGGYAIAWLWSAGCALALHHVFGLERVDAALLATLGGYVVYPVAVLTAWARLRA